jgi:probable HAF family extracellular repeat protein
MNTIFSSKTRRKSHKTAFTFACLLALAAAHSASAVESGTVIDPPTLGGSAPTYIYGVNNFGQVAGNAYIPNDAGRHTFIYDKGAMTAVGTLGGRDSYPKHINDQGYVVGWSHFSTSSTSTNRAFLYHNGTMHDLGTLGGVNSQATAVNRFGQVTGNADLSGNTAWRPFLYSNGVMRDLGSFGGNRGYAVGINNRGEVAGYSDLPDKQFRAFLYTGGVMRNLGTLGGYSSEASDLNENGQVTGHARLASGAYHAFLYSGSTMQGLGTLGGNLSQGRALDAAGHVVGWSWNANSQSRAFLYTNGAMQDLGTLGGPTSDAKDINNHGHIVGVADTDQFVAVPSTNPYETQTRYVRVVHAFIWKNGVMHDLNSFLPPDSGWELKDAYSINEAGYIRCNARRSGETQDRTVILSLNGTPVAANDTYSVPEDSRNYTMRVLANDSARTAKDKAVTIDVVVNSDWDVDGDPLKVTLATQGSKGSVTITGDHTVRYTPQRNFIGSDSFTYTISDGNGRTAKATVTVSVDRKLTNLLP